MELLPHEQIRILVLLYKAIASVSIVHSAQKEETEKQRTLEFTPGDRTGGNGQRHWSGEIFCVFQGLRPAMAAAAFLFLTLSLSCS